MPLGQISPHGLGIASTFLFFGSACQSGGTALFRTGLDAQKGRTVAAEQIKEERYEAFSGSVLSGRIRGSFPLIQLTIALGAIAAVGALGLAAVSSGLPAGVWLTLIGAGLGFCLYRSGFGFASGYRALLRTGDSTHVRAQIVMLGLAIVLFTPALAAGSLFGSPVRGFVFPVGVALVAGALVFGIGMQLAGGCGSGTLYTVGGGSVRMLVTLASFIVGATVAAYAWPVWSALPTLSPISLPASLGHAGGVAVQLGFLALLWILASRRERRLTGHVASIWRRKDARIIRGPWPYGWSAAGLSILAFATLWVAGRPWGITQAFALWGSRAVELSNLDDPHFWPFWEEPTRVEALARPLLADATSVMNLGLMLGALLAAALAGAFRPVWRIGPGALSSAVLGGLLLGVGAIMATGCNISAFFSGVASGSAHGWVWIGAALIGTAIGLRLRPLFGLDTNAKQQDQM